MTNQDFTWKTIPNNKDGLKTRISTGVRKINRRYIEELQDSDSSSDPLPENVLANYTSNNISSDYDTDIENDEIGKMVLNETMEVASVKSEPLSEDEEKKTKSFSEASSKKKKLRTSDSRRSDKVKLAPCTPEQYNEFLRNEKAKNGSSVGNDSSYLNEKEINHFNGIFQKELSSSEKEVKKKKKRKTENYVNNEQIITSNKSLIEEEKHKNKKNKRISDKVKLAPCTTEEYNDFLKNEIIVSNSDLLKVNSKTFSADEVNIDKMFTENNSTEIKKKKKKKKGKCEEACELQTAIQNTSNEEIIPKERKKKKKLYSSTQETLELHEHQSEKSQRFSNSPVRNPDKYSNIYFNEKNVNPSIDSKQNNSFNKKIDGTDKSAQILKLNNMLNNSSDSESSENEHNISHTTPCDKKSETDNLTKLKTQNNESSDTEDEQLGVKPRYSFQFNRSYDNNTEGKTIKEKHDLSLSNKANKSPEAQNFNSKYDNMPNVSTKKLAFCKSTLPLKHIANSTALESSSFEMDIPDTSMANMSNIKDIDKCAKHVIPSRQQVHDLTQLDKSSESNSFIKEYLAKNDHLEIKDYCSNAGFDKLGDDNEVFLVQCPRSVDPNLFIDQNIFDSSFHYDGADYKFTTVNNPIQNISIFLPSKRTGIVKTLPLFGHIIVETDLKPSHLKKVKKTKTTVVEFPDNLKIRHPIFGNNFEEKLKIPEHVLCELSRHKHKKSKKHKKHSKLSIKNESEINETTTFSFGKQRQIKSEPEDLEVPKKKKKKGIQQECEDLWTNDDIAKNLFDKF